MAKRSREKKKSKPIDLAKAKLRGVIGAARNSTTYSVSGSYSNDLSKRKTYFSQSLSSNLLLARQELPFNDYDDFLEWSDKQQANLLPKSFREVKPTLSSLSFVRDTREISLLSEAFWLSNRLLRERETIIEFLRLRGLIEDSFWHGNVDEIYNLFSEMESKLGQSVWLVEAKLSIEQLFKGLESQKRILEEIRKDAGRGFIRFLSHRMSMRNEPAVTTQRFASNLNAYIASKPNLKEGTAEYLRFKLCHEVPTVESEISAVLRFQQNHSTIDCYEGLVNITQELIGLEGKQEYLRILLGALLRVQVDDHRVTKLAIVLGGRETEKEFLCDVESAGLLLKGDLRDAIFCALRAFRLLRSKDIFQLYVAAQAHSFRSEHLPVQNKKDRCPQRDFTRFLSDVIAKNSHSAASYDILDKTLRNFHIFPSCKAFLDIARREHDPLAYRNEKAKLYFFLNNSRFSPLDTPADSETERLLYEKGTSNELAVQCFVQTRRMREPNGALLPYLASAVAVISGAFQQREHKLILATIESLKVLGEYSRVESRLKLIEIDALISTGENREVIRELGEVISQGRSYVDLLPFSALVNKRTKWADLRQYADEIAVPIFIHQAYKTNPSDILSTLRRTAVDSFIRSHGLEGPSNLSDHIYRFGERNIIYFFKNLCTSSILDMCKCVDGTKAVDEERLRILGALIEIDPDCADIYKDEILTLSSSLRIREGLKLVDGSRIHVDLEGISRWAHAELQESLSRYKSLVQAGVGIADDLDDVLKDFLNQTSPKAYLDVPKSEADDIVVSMLWELRDRFLFDKPHGLNSYLSKRVRHNSIGGYLRGALDKDSLITGRLQGLSATRLLN